MKASKQSKDNLVTLVSVPSETDAAPIMAALQSAHIAATMTGGFTAGFIAEAPGEVEIKIFAADLEMAKKVLAQTKTESKSIDWSKVDVGHPADE